MIRLIVTTTDLNHYIHAGGEIVRTAKTFDIEHPDLERALSVDPNAYVTASLTYELRPTTPANEKE